MLNVIIKVMLFDMAGGARSGIGYGIQNWAD